MTYTPTHIALQGLVLWNLLPKNVRTFYQEYRRDFLLINLLALFPDIDILFGVHRTYTHSILIPTVLLLLVLVLEQIDRKFTIFQKEKKRVFFAIKLFLLMWLFHIFLDFGWDHLLLFWPLDNHFYDFTLFFRFSTKSWFLLPLTFLGLVPRWRLYSYDQGLNRFFINLSEQERQTQLGDFIDLSIPELSLHLLLIATWLVVIVFPVFRRKKNKKEDTKTRKFLKIVKHRIKRQLTGLGLFIVVLGLLLGPAIGTVNEYTTQFSLNFNNTHTDFDPTLGFVLENEKRTQIDLNMTIEEGLVDYNATLSLVSNETFYSFFDRFENLTQNYFAENISFTNLYSLYTELIDETKNSAYKSIVFVDLGSYKNVQYSFNKTDDSTRYILCTLDDWDMAFSFLYAISVEIVYSLERIMLFYEGLIVSSFGFLLVVIDQILYSKEKEEKIKKTIEKN